MALSKGSLIYVYELNSSQEFDFIATFISIRKAAQFLNTSHSTISRCIDLGKLYKNKYKFSLSSLHPSEFNNNSE
jgi:hypothetical protein